jgi:predicted RNase H-related nuclease YkuK (DUF458 family)
VNYAGTFDLLLYYHNEADESKDGFCIFDYKGLPVDTPIMTDSGWMKMGDISTADKVLDKNGKWTKIKHVSEIHHNPCMKLYFSNGHSIVADSDHRWLVYINDEEQVKTTAELKDYMNEHKYYRPDFPKISICNSVDKIDTSIANGSLPAVYMNFWDFLFFCKGSRLTNKKKDFLKNRIIERKMEFHERIFLEVTESLEISKRLLKILNEKKLVEKFKELEIHIDAGNRGKTKEILTALKGMVLGCGFTCKVKPESCGASKVADKYSKCY